MCLGKKFIRPEPNLTYIHDTKGLKLLARLRLGLSHLGYHKFRQLSTRLCVSHVYLRPGYWNNNQVPPSLPQSSLCKENSLSQDKSSKWKHLNTE